MGTSYQETIKKIKLTATCSQNRLLQGSEDEQLPQETRSRSSIVWHVATILSSPER